MAKAAPIKVLHVVFSLDPGGMENGLVNVANALRPEEFQVHVCCLEQAGDFARRLPQPRNVRALGKRPGFSMKAVVGLAKMISEVKPHVVHSHNLGPLIYSGLASGFGRWRPILHGEHGLLPDECEPKRLRQRDWLYRCCEKVHTVSDGLRQQLINFGLPGAKITPVLNGVNTSRFTPGNRLAARKKIGCVPLDAKVLGIVGRFGAFKRHAVLIDAFNLLAREDENIHLMIVGGQGPERDRVQTQAQASPAAKRIHFTGFQEDPVPHYQAMDLLVAPSLVEGLCNVVLEAMACGIPVLAHRACGNTEMITHGKDGFIADLATAEKLHAQLKRTLGQPEQLERLGRAARESVAKEFSMSRMVHNYERLYREVVRRTGTKMSMF